MATTNISTVIDKQRTRVIVNASAFNSMSNAVNQLRKLDFDSTQFIVSHQNNGIHVKLRNPPEENVFHFKVEKSDLQALVIHGGRWTRYIDDTEYQIELTCDDSDSGEYASYKTVTNVTHDCYCYLELDDPDEPTTLTAKITDDDTYPTDDDNTKLVLAKIVVNTESTNIATIEQYWTGGDIIDTIGGSAYIDMYHISEATSESSSESSDFVQRDVNIRPGLWERENKIAATSHAYNNDFNPLSEAGAANDYTGDIYVYVVLLTLIGSQVASTIDLDHTSAWWSNSNGCTIKFYKATVATDIETYGDIGNQFHLIGILTYTAGELTQIGQAWQGMISDSDPINQGPYDVSSDLHGFNFNLTYASDTLDDFSVTVKSNLNYHVTSKTFGIYTATDTTFTLTQLQSSNGLILSTVLPGSGVSELEADPGLAATLSHTIVLDGVGYNKATWDATYFGSLQHIICRFALLSNPLIMYGTFNSTLHQRSYYMRPDGVDTDLDSIDDHRPRCYTLGYNEETDHFGELEDYKVLRKLGINADIFNYNEDLGGCYYKLTIDELGKKVEKEYFRFDSSKADERSADNSSLSIEITSDNNIDGSLLLGLYKIRDKTYKEEAITTSEGTFLSLNSEYLDIVVRDTTDVCTIKYYNTQDLKVAQAESADNIKEEDQSGIYHPLLDPGGPAGGTPPAFSKDDWGPNEDHEYAYIRKGTTYNTETGAGAWLQSIGYFNDYAKDGATEPASLRIEFDLMKFFLGAQTSEWCFLDGTNQIIYYADTKTSINWGTGTANYLDATNRESILWNNSMLYRNVAESALSVDWGNSYLYDEGGNVSVDWADYELQVSGISNLDWALKELQTGDWSIIYNFLAGTPGSSCLGSEESWFAGVYSELYTIVAAGGSSCGAIYGGSNSVYIDSNEDLILTNNSIIINGETGLSTAGHTNGILTSTTSLNSHVQDLIVGWGLL